MHERPADTETILISLPEDIFAVVETIAKASEQPMSWVIIRALRRYNGD